MEQSIQQKISAGYRADLVECIEKALIGQLSPSDQEYCFEEIKSLKGTDEYPPDGDHLLCQLRDILSITPQISEHDYETSAVESFGGRLLLFDYYDRYTLLELVEQPNGAGYDSFVFISNAKHGAAFVYFQSDKQNILFGVHDGQRIFQALGRVMRSVHMDMHTTAGVHNCSRMAQGSDDLLKFFHLTVLQDRRIQFNLV